MEYWSIGVLGDLYPGSGVMGEWSGWGHGNLYRVDTFVIGN